MHLGGLVMILTKYKIGDLIEVVDERNNLGIREFFGININKEFMSTAANTEGLDETKYKVIRKNRFVFSGMQTGRDECIRISMYTKQNPILVSPAYTTFEVVATDVVLPMYFFLCFLSHEKDRFGSFLSDGSIRSNLDWPVFCDIELNIPPIKIQKKYVDIYNAMVSNQECYERGLEDLKLTCDAYIENLRRKMPCMEIGPYLRECNEKNEGNAITLFQGVNVDHVFTKPKRVAEDSENGSVVRTGQFAFNKVMKSNRTKLPIALREGPDCVVSNSYQVFEITDTKKLNPKYLLMWFNRTETQRYAGFISFGTTRDIFTFEDMGKIAIPIPSVEIQQDVVDIFTVYQERSEINERLKIQLKDICPILIKGSIEEARKEA